MSFKVFFITAVFALVLAPFTTQAGGFVDDSMEISSDKQGAEAKQDAFDRAIEQTALKLAGELLGVESAQKIWPTVSAKVLKNSSRFVIFIKGSTPTQEGLQTKVLVSLRYSPDNFETILRESGAMLTGPLRLLPLFRVLGADGVTYAWWSDAENVAQNPAQANLEAQFKKAYVELARKMKVKNIFVLDPTNPTFRMSVPAAYRMATLTKDDQIVLAQYLKADVVLSGKIETQRSKSESNDLELSYDLQLWQSKAGRSIGEFKSSEKLSSESSKAVLALIEASSPKVLGEVASRLSDAVVGGHINLSILKISVAGALTYRQQTEFKRQLSQMRELKTLKERMFEADRIEFEAETGTTAQELAKLFERTQFPLYKVEVDNIQDDGLALRVKAMSSSSAQ